MQHRVWTVAPATNHEKPTVGLSFRLKLTSPESVHAADSSVWSFQKGEQSKDKLQGAVDNDKNGVGSQDLFKFSCPETSCERKFPSLKSLHGHLRSHPERSYRGSKPPSTTDSDKQRQYLHGDQDLPKWSMKRKRGCDIIQNVDSEIWEAANILVAMKRASSGPIEEMQEYACKDLASTVSKSEKKNHKVANSECEMNLPFNPEKKGSYMCTTCKRSFTTYQALGGHKSFCNKIKMGANTVVDGIDNAGWTTVGEHRCRVCSRAFATGRALGGHMRGHQPMVVVPLIQISEGPSDHRSCDFDLNVEPAAPQD